jgi:hypothetical protein
VAEGLATLSFKVASKQFAVVIDMPAVAGEPDNLVGASCDDGAGE